MKAAKGEAVSFLGRVREGFAGKTCLSWVLQEEYLGPAGTVHKDECTVISRAHPNSWG